MSRALPAHLAGRVQGNPGAIWTQGSPPLPMEPTSTSQTPVGRRGPQNNAEFWHRKKNGPQKRVHPAPRPAGAPRTPAPQPSRDSRGPLEHWYEPFPPISHPVPPPRSHDRVFKRVERPHSGRALAHARDRDRQGDQFSPPRGTSGPQPSPAADLHA